MMNPIEDLSRGPEFRVGGYPDPSIAEDPETGLRWLISSRSVSRWDIQRAISRGAVGIASPVVGGWAVTSTESMVGLAETSSHEIAIPDGIFVPVLQGQPILPPTGVASRRRFVHLHAHSEYSPLDGLSSVSEMVDAALADGQDALAVTDHGTCAAHAEFLGVSAKKGIKPIFGIEANLVNDRFDRTPEKRLDYWHFIMLAGTDEGLKNVWAASTESHLRGHYGRARMDWDVLEKFSSGVYASTACLRGPLADIILHEGDETKAKGVISRLQAIYGDRLFLELHCNDVVEDGRHIQRELNEALVSLARDMSLPLIVVADSHYSCADHKTAHQIWIASQTDRTLQDESALFAGGHDYHVSTADEVAASISYLPPDVVAESMQNTVALADMCDVTIRPQGSIPVFHRTHENPAQRDSEVMRQILEEAFSRRCAHLPNVEVYRQRLDYEIGVIEGKGFCGYMLIVAEYCTWAKQNGILVGPGRGSAAGCLVAWLLGTTGLDPIKGRLMFERFLNPERTSLPDIDQDFPSSKRPDITNHIIERWGADRTARIGTESRLKNKGVIDAVVKTLKPDPRRPLSEQPFAVEVEWADIVAIKAIIEDAESGSAGLGVSWDDLWVQHEEQLRPFALKYPTVFEFAEILVGRLKTYGRHPAGIVISPEGSVLDWLPMRAVDDMGTVVTQFPAEFVEFLGLVKFDILTVRTLDTVQEAVDLIRADPRLSELTPDFMEWDIDDYDDPMVWDMLCAGHTKGVFQIETGSGTALTRQYQPRSLDDLCAILTLVRPGPMQSGITRSYIERRFDRESVEILHPLLEQVLMHTYQLMIYQEDVMAVCQHLGGYTLAEADGVRSILGKKKVDKVVEEGLRFVERCDARGIDHTLSSELWDKMALFAKYAFNRSHSLAYSAMSYWCAWLKCHFPAHYYVALMSTAKKERIPDFVVDARGRGYGVLLPDINDSQDGFSIASDGVSIRYGLSSLKGIGDAPARAIVEGRPWLSWDDFIERKPSSVNMGHVQTLVEIGAFDSILTEGQDRSSLEVIVQRIKEGQQDICRFKVDSTNPSNGLPCSFDWSSEPVVLGKSGKPIKGKPLPKKCTRACRQFDSVSLVEWGQGVPLSPGAVRAREREVLGTWVSHDPFEHIREETFTDVPAGSTHRIFRGSEILAAPQGSNIMTIGLVTSVRTKRDRTGRMMGWVNLYCKDAEIEAVVFGSVWDVYGADIFVDQFASISLRVTDRGAQLNRLHPLSLIERGA